MARSPNNNLNSGSAENSLEHLAELFASLTMSPYRTVALVLALRALADVLEDNSDDEPTVVSSTQRTRASKVAPGGVVPAAPALTTSSTRSGLTLVTSVRGGASPASGTFGGPSPALTSPAPMSTMAASAVYPYHMPSSSEGGGTVYVITRGWLNVAPLVFSVSHATYLAVDDIDAGHHRMANALAARTAIVIPHNTSG
ncbi:hypothetical protein BDN71DRAFT_1506412 [Pleurotus eryngii]|uniref:Uncharacterized protein n=1 Tax=Pleurotus eryngii TaxID=5323 RepID=A0A9P6DGE7_PLEER|nr:hypothetical protein BDN71DRAFT_1506412 [Pleurotus eryngii]